MPVHVVGVDGGGRRTTAVLAGPAGEILGRGHAGSSDYRAVGAPVARAALLSAVQLATAQARVGLDQVQAATWALAETGTPLEASPFPELAAAMLPHLSVSLVGSGAAALAAGGVRRGVALLAGDGALAYGRNAQGEQARAGGWGHLLDEGGAYALARGALQAVLAAADDEHLFASTSLPGRVLVALELDDAADVAARLHDPRLQAETLAGLAAVAIEAAEAGDVLAAGIVARAADALAWAADSVARRLGLWEQDLPLVLAGELPAEHPFYRALVVQAVRTRLPGARPTLLQADLAAGAARLALESLGRPVDQSTGREPESAPTGDPLWASEQPNLLSRNLDLLTPLQIVGLMHVEDRRAVAAVMPVLPEVARAVEAVAGCLRGGGRLIYVGGGSAGRIGVLDASEFPDTFSAPPDLAVGVMAGGPPALLWGGEPDEDDTQAARKAMAELAVGPGDAVVGISSSGRTPYTLAAVDEARRRGALTIALVCNLPAPLAERAEHVIAPLVGPEVLTGSTRLKAGTVQKLVSNMLSTAAMVRLGKTYGNRMVDLSPRNEKLRDRARRLVAEIGGVDEAQAAAALERSQGEVKTAVLVARAGISPADARERLAQAGGVLRTALAGSEVG